MALLFALGTTDWGRKSDETVRGGNRHPSHDTGIPDASPDIASDASDETQFRSYRDCMFFYGERRELADGRCDYLPR